MPNLPALKRAFCQYIIYSCMTNLNFILSYQWFDAFDWHTNIDVRCHANCEAYTELFAFVLSICASHFMRGIQYFEWMECCGSSLIGGSIAGVCVFCTQLVGTHTLGAKWWNTFAYALYMNMNIVFIFGAKTYRLCTSNIHQDLMIECSW